MNLSNVPVNELRKELERRERGSKKLEAQRDKLMNQISKIEKLLGDVRGEPSRSAPRNGRRVVARSAGKRGRKAGGEMTLGGYLAKVIKPNEVVGPSEALAKIQEAGYKSGAKSLPIMIAVRLSKDANFKKIGRGKYKRVA